MKRRNERWIPGLYRDKNDCYQFDGEMDADTFTTAAVHLNRNDMPTLLFDLFCNGALDVALHPGVVGTAWSKAEYPTRCLEPAIWVKLFAVAGYTHDFDPAPRPTEPVELYRGCTPAGRLGMSWTSDLPFARRFAYGGASEPSECCVYCFDSPPGAVLAFIRDAPGRPENEYIIDPAYLSDDSVKQLADRPIPTREPSA
jgi:hypothetical protein